MGIQIANFCTIPVVRWASLPADYVEFFLLQDMVNEDFTEVRFCLPFKDFKTSLLPLDKEAYLSYKQCSVEFIEARNSRIRAYCQAIGSA